MVRAFERSGIPQSNHGTTALGFPRATNGAELPSGTKRANYPTNWTGEQWQNLSQRSIDRPRSAATYLMRHDQISSMPITRILRVFNLTGHPSWQ
jgi:hypothetical protein